ncbi:putative SLC26A/SulP transporter [Helianthus debilis subsp. tardiflorus]
MRLSQIHLNFYVLLHCNILCWSHSSCTRVFVLLGTLLQDEVEPNTREFLRLAFTATFFAGVTQAALGFFRLSFLINFQSHAAIVGFMGGVVVTIPL